MGCSCSNFMRIVLVVGVLDVFEVAVLRPPATTIFGSSPWDVRRLWLQYLRYHLEIVECRIKFKTDLSSHFRSRGIGGGNIKVNVDEKMNVSK